jgi:hypothetical protein
MRRIVIRTSVSFGPLSFETASSTDILVVDSPSMVSITSPARMPSREAGVPSIGVITVSRPLRRPTRMPRP